MLETLIALRDELRRREELDYIRDKDISVVPSLTSLPGEGMPKFPCIGIKDGKSVRQESTCGSEVYTLPIHIIIYTKLHKDEQASVIGDASSSRKGILQVQSDLEAVLRKNRLGLDAVEYPEMSGSDASQLFLDPETGEGTQRKECIITYTKEVFGCCS